EHHKDNLGATRCCATRSSAGSLAPASRKAAQSRGTSLATLSPSRARPHYPFGLGPGGMRHSTWHDNLLYGSPVIAKGTPHTRRNPLVQHILAGRMGLTERAYMTAIAASFLVPGRRKRGSLVLSFAAGRAFAPRTDGAAADAAPDLA